MRDQLQNTLGHKLSATLIFDYPTVQALAAYLNIKHSNTTSANVSPGAEVNGFTADGPNQTLVEELQQIAASLLGHVVPANTPLMESGLDSLGKAACVCIDHKLCYYKLMKLV